MLQEVVAMKLRESSPFSALTYKEQQDRWLEWRSRQLEYKNVSDVDDCVKNDIPPLRLPHFSEDAIYENSSTQCAASNSRQQPYRHAQLDQVIARHHSAIKNTSNWQTALTFQVNSAKGQ